MSWSDAGDDEAVPHRPRQVDGKVAVVCSSDGTVYGAGGERAPLYCPYCGGNARGDGHHLDPERQTVECSFSASQTVKSCPGCGESLVE